MSDNNNVSTKKQDINDDNQQEKLVPELRFPGFNDEWKKVKLGDIFEFYPTNSFSRSKLNYNNGTVKNIHYGDIHTKFPTIMDINKNNIPFINADINIDKFKTESFCKNGDIIIADASEDYDEIGKTIEITGIKDNDRILSGLHTLLARDNNNMLADKFRGYLFQSNSLKLQIKRMANGISVLGISKSNIKKIEVYVPSKSEQYKISNIIYLIDKKIELLERKQNLVLNEKFINIQNLILKIKNENSKVPLDEIFNFKKGKGLSKNKVSNEGKYKAILYGELYTTYNEIPDKIISFTNCDEGVLSEKGDLLIPASTTTNGIDLVNSTIINEEGVHLGGDINILRNKHNVQINSLFIGIFLEYGLRKEIFRLTQGSTIIHLYGKDLKKLNVNLPSIEKQNKISELFKYYLNKEKLIENKIKMMKNYKKALLQQMFV